MRHALPPAYPGEILYGTYARFVRALGKLPHFTAGPKRVHPQRHLSPLGTCGIPGLIRLLAYPEPLKVAHLLLSQLSVLNYAKCFLTPDGRYKLNRCVEADDARRLGRLMFASFHGQRRKLALASHFRFCDECVAEDRATYGEAWWHLSHFSQTPWCARLMSVGSRSLCTTTCQ